MKLWPPSVVITEGSYPEHYARVSNWQASRSLLEGASSNRANSEGKGWGSQRVGGRLGRLDRKTLSYVEYEPRSDRPEPGCYLGMLSSELLQ